MGLVQVPAGNVSKSAQFIDIDGTRITWEHDVDEMNNRYGPLIIDYVKSYFGEKLLVEYEGRRC